MLAGDITDKSVQKQVLDFVERVLKQQEQLGRPVDGILVAAGPPCKAYSQAKIDPTNQDSGGSSKKLETERRADLELGDLIRKGRAACLGCLMLPPVRQHR